MVKIGLKGSKMGILELRVYINPGKLPDDHNLLEVPEDTLFTEECAWEMGNDILRV